MKFEEVYPALREGKGVRRKGSEIIYRPRHFLFINKSDFSADDWEIVEEKKKSADDLEIVEEKKKVKLRDLTKEQFDRRIEKYCDGNCENCVYEKVICDSSLKSSWIRNKDLYSDKFLDQEIEVEEDD